MVGVNGNTPIRNKKVGLPDPQANGGQPTVATTEPSAMVRQMAAQNFALKNGGQMPPVMQGSPNSSIPPVATVQPMNVFAGGNQIIGRYNVPASPQQNPASAVPDPQNGTEGVQFTNPADTGQNNLDSLSAALNGTAQQPQQPQFQADPSQRDGGFFNWVKGLIPKKRPGRREGETDDEYDARRTRNMQMVATLADAIRHMGNIVNTSKGAPLQQFNDPNTMLEQGRQARKAERQKQAALDADAADRQANLSLKERAAEAERLYKQLSLGYKDAADKRDRDKFNYQIAKDAAAAQRQAEQDKQKQDNWERQFNARQQQNAISNRLREMSINKRGSGRSGGSGRGGSGSGAGNSYPLYNPNTGLTEHFKNEKSWIARANELGYNTETPSSSTTSQEVYDKNGIKKVSNTTRGKSVAAQIGKQMAQKKAATKGKGKKGDWASGFKL